MADRSGVESMNALSNTHVAVIISAGFFIAPWILFNFLCTEHRTPCAFLQGLLRSIRALQYASILFAFVLLLLSLVRDGFHNFFFYTLGLGGFSVGLTPTVNWLKEKFDQEA